VNGGLVKICLKNPAEMITENRECFPVFENSRKSICLLSQGFLRSGSNLGIMIVFT